MLFGCREDEADPEAELAHRYAEAVCAPIFACDCEVQALVAPQSECVRQIGTQMSHNQRAAQSAGLTFDPACLETHLALLEALDCAQPLDEFLANGELEGCQLYHGTRGEGEACERLDDVGLYSYMSDCEQGLACAYGGGVCAPPEVTFVPLVEGAPCIDDEGQSLGSCSDAGFACDEAGSRVCVVPAAIGEPCPNDFPCADGWCNAGTCEARKPVGAACSGALECETFVCEQALCSAKAEASAACNALAL